MDVRDRAAHGLRDLRDNRTCQHCRNNKLRCTGERPRCAACVARSASCEYNDAPAAAGRKRPAPAMSYAQVKESRQRKRAAAAQTSCDFCRNDLRRKCDGLRPSCQSCIKRGEPCVYSGPASIPPPTTAGSSRQKTATTSPDDDSDAAMNSRDGSPDIPLADHAPVQDPSRPRYPLGNGLGHAGSSRNPDGTNCTRPVACFFCIHVEIPCTGDYPTCVNCIRRNLVCNYPDPSSYAHQFPRQSAMHTRQLKDSPSTRPSTRLSIDSSTSASAPTSARTQPPSASAFQPTPTPPSMSASPDLPPYTPTTTTPTPTPNANTTTFRSPSNQNLNPSPSPRTQPSSHTQPPTPTQATTPSERVITDVRVLPSDARAPVGGVLVSPSGRTRDGASLMRERSGSGGHTIPYTHGRTNSGGGEGDGFIHEGPATYRVRMGSGSGAGMGVGGSAGGDMRVNDASFRNGLNGAPLSAAAPTPANGIPSIIGAPLPLSTAMAPGRTQPSPTRAPASLQGGGQAQRSPNIQTQPPTGQAYQQSPRPTPTQATQQPHASHQQHPPSLASQPPPPSLAHQQPQQQQPQQPPPPSNHASQPPSRRASLVGAGVTVDAGRSAAADVARGAPSDAMGRMALDGANQNRPASDPANRGAAPDQAMRSVGPEPPARNGAPDPSARNAAQDTAIRNAAPDATTRSAAPDPAARNVPPVDTSIRPRGLTQVQVSAAGSPVVLDPRAAEARARAEDARAGPNEPRSRVEDEVRRNNSLPPRPHRTLSGPTGRLPPRTLADPMRDDTRRGDPRRDDPRRDSFPGPRRDRYDSGPSIPQGGRYDPIANYRREPNAGDRDRRDSLMSDRERRDSLPDRDRRGSIPGPGRDVEARVWQPGPRAALQSQSQPQTQPSRTAVPMGPAPPPPQPAPLITDSRISAPRGETSNAPSPHTPRNPPLEPRAGGGGARERSPVGGAGGKKSPSPTTPHRSRAGSKRRSVSPRGGANLRAESGSRRSSPMDMDMDSS